MPTGVQARASTLKDQEEATESVAAAEDTWAVLTASYISQSLMLRMGISECRWVRRAFDSGAS